MSNDPRSRDHLRQRLDQTIGEEASDTLMEALPPVPSNELATKADLGELEQRLGARVDGVEERLGARVDGVEERLGARVDGVEERLGARVDGVEERLGLRLGGTEERIGGLEQTLALRIDEAEQRTVIRLEATEHKLSAVFRGELNAAVTAQTRAMLVSTFTTAVGVGSLVLAAAKIG